MVTRTGHQRRIVKGLPSLAGSDGTFAYGPSDVSVKDGHVFVSIGGPNEAENRERLTEAIAKKLGTVQLLFGRHSITVGEIAEFVAGNDPDGPPAETNTNSVLAGRRALYAIDAGGNTLYGINWRGRLEVLHVFDDIVLPDGTTIDAVPTNMVFGPDGAVYVVRSPGCRSQRARRRYGAGTGCRQHRTPKDSRRPSTSTSDPTAACTSSRCGGDRAARSGASHRARRHPHRRCRRARLSDRRRRG